MVNASLSFASLASFLFILWSVYGSIHAARQAKHLSNPTDYYFLAVGRIVLSCWAGGIVFFQGWRLDPTLQLGVVLLILSACAESLVVNRNLRK